MRENLISQTHLVLPHAGSFISPLRPYADLLNEYAVAKSMNTQNKVKKAYSKFDLLIIDEWLLRPLPESEAYDLLELIDACSRKGALILCTQYDVDDWYYRYRLAIGPKMKVSAVAEGILDRIINNKYSIEVKGRISMRKRHAFSDEGSEVNGNADNTIYDLLDEVNCADSCEAVTALCELIDELLKDIQHLELECISTRYLLSRHMDEEQGSLLRSDILENLGRRHYDSPAYQLFKERSV